MINAKVPNVSHLRVWGCVCYALINTNDPYRYKLSPTSLKGIFVGYCESTTQYKVYVPSKIGRNKIIISANVRFLEDVYWDWKTTSTECFDVAEYEQDKTLNQKCPDNMPTEDSDSESDSDSDSPLLHSSEHLTQPPLNLINSTLIPPFESSRSEVNNEVPSLPNTAETLTQKGTQTETVSPDLGDRAL